ncbi:hypothetical protein [Rhizobium sp. F40D2]|uniref:hypothetical protein n=1 Tax=Rhizobium sp. F40D2 TaxID=3453141 RepID=UPI003F232713
MSGLYPLDSKSNDLEVVTELLDRVSRRSPPAAELFKVGRALAQRLADASFQKNDEIVVVIEAEEVDSLGAGFLSGLSEFSVCLVCLWAERVILKTRANFGKIAQREIVEIMGQYAGKVPREVDHLVILQGCDVRPNYIHAAILKLGGMTLARDTTVATPVAFDDAQARITAQFSRSAPPKLSIVALCGVTGAAPQAISIAELRDRPAELLQLDVGEFKTSYIPDIVALILERSELVSDVGVETELPQSSTPEDEPSEVPNDNAGTRSDEGDLDDEFKPW